MDERSTEDEPDRPQRAAEAVASRTRPRTDVFRAWICSVVATPGAVGLGALLVWTTDLTMDDLVPYGLFGVYWPVYVALYVAWGCRAYGIQSQRSLHELVGREVRTQRRWYHRLAGLTGTADVLVSAGGVAVLVVIYIAQQPTLRQESALVVLGLLTVAASWVMMVFFFAQLYLRLDVRGGTGRQLVFEAVQEPRFGDYLDTALMASTMGAGLPVRPVTRRAWRLVRTNTVVAFAFNSVIVAMMVSLLFGGVTS